jgi:ketosteroid isomerase-like protein
MIQKRGWMSSLCRSSGSNQRIFMKNLLLMFFGDLSIVTMATAQTDMNHATALSAYVEALNTHSWDRIAPHVAEDAVFIFTEDTFVGKAAAKGAFEKTFKLIENEVFSLHDIVWTVITDDVAACRYEFRWKGLISGQEASGGGRGTSILRKVDGRWLIAHEHLGPYPRK